MDVMELGAIGEFVSGLAVIGSLIYVGYQVRLANVLATAQAHEAANRTANDMIHLFADPVNIDFMVRSVQQPKDLSHKDQIRQRMLLQSQANYYETLFYANERGAVDDDIWQSRVERMRLMNLFDLRGQWEDISPLLGSRFRAFLKHEVLESDAPRIAGVSDRNPGKAL